MSDHHTFLSLRSRFHAFCGGLALFLCALAPSAVEAQISCSGPNCALIPLTPDEYNAIFYEFQNQYTSEVFDKIAESLILANAAGPYIGTVNLNTFTAGGYASAGFRPVEDKDIYIPNVGIIEDAPSAGASVNGRFFAGINLGYLMGKAHDPYADGAVKPGWLSPYRFDIYFSFIDHSESMDSIGDEIDGSIDGHVQSQKVELRYHLVEGSNIAAGPLLRFRGVSLGVGVATTSQRVTFGAETNTLEVALQEGVTLEWAGRDNIFWENNIRSFPVEITTGIQLLYLFNITVGAGYVHSDGDTRFILTRNGPVTIRSSAELPQIPEEYLDYIPADLLSSFQGNSEVASLGISLYDQSEVPKDIYYWKGGLEFNLWILKLGIEGMTTGRTYGATVGARFEF